jgi:predicted membrane GTPase involved in stress response
LLGLRNAMLTASRGTAVLNTVFHGYAEWAGEISTREQGSLVAFETGTSTSYALFSCQERGNLFLSPGVEVYKGQIIGIHQRPGDLSLNACKRKAATNVRSNKEATGNAPTCPFHFSRPPVVFYTNLYFQVCLSCVLVSLFFLQGNSFCLATCLLHRFIFQVT